MSENMEVQLVENVQVSGSKLVTNQPTEIKSVDIPIIPERDHVEYEVTKKRVRIKNPVLINEIQINICDSGGYMVCMPGGKVKWMGGHQTLHIDSMENLVQLIARTLGQTTYEYYEMDKDEYEADMANLHLKPQPTISTDSG